ncbi:MAG: hypothetical protein HXX14_15250 [Bacteroidetes bacterium]|nr:hypothetical protein [Bacteroidota bacterium]
MITNLLLGLSLIALGAFSSGSFAVPFGKIKGWTWESQWLIYGVGAYVLFPLIACLIFTPNFITIYKLTSTTTLVTVFLLGAVYGVGNLSFGLALRYLGLSLGYAFALGLMLVIGTLIPPMIDGKLWMMMATSGGHLLIIGVAVAAVGIFFSAWSGILKDKTISQEKQQESVSEFNLFKGFMAAILVGITGSAMALGFEQGLPISNVAQQQGIDPLFSMMPLLVILFSGTFITTLIWCLFLGYKSKSISNYFKAESTKTLTFNYLFALLAGFLWFSQFIVYGMGKSKMGPYTFTSWGILMALTIAFATIWGLIRKEWKGASRKVYIIMVISLIVIIASSFIIGISGSI